MPKINQILAIEKGKKTQINKDLTELHRLTQQPGLMVGHSKSFQPKDEDGETFPPDDRHVQVKHQDAIQAVSQRLASLFDVTATKDWSNCHALADVVVDGEVFIDKVPVTFLLFLEKQLTDLHTFVKKIAELDPAIRWHWDENTGQYYSDATKTHKTKKLQKPIVLYPHTDEHPAQTQLLTEDVVIGHWSTVHFSGAIPRPKKLKLLERIVTLHEAVKFARESANSLEAVSKKVGDKVLGFIFAEVDA